PCPRKSRWRGWPAGSRCVAKMPDSRPELIEEVVTIVPSLSAADHSVSPPKIHIPRDYNAAYDLIERNLSAGRAGKVAFVDDTGRYTFGELAERVKIGRASCRERVWGAGGGGACVGRKDI